MCFNAFLCISPFLTTFYVNTKLYRYKRLTMGIKPAQGELNTALRALFAHIPYVHLIHDDYILKLFDHSLPVATIIARHLSSRFVASIASCSVHHFVVAVAQCLKFKIIVWRWSSKVKWKIKAWLITWFQHIHRSPPDLYLLRCPQFWYSL